MILVKILKLKKDTLWYANEIESIFLCYPRVGDVYIVFNTGKYIYVEDCEPVSERNDNWFVSMITGKIHTIDTATI